MFKKLVANLSYSPSLIHELDSYSKSLKRGLLYRKAGLFLLVLLLIVELFTFFIPANSSNQKSSNDLIPFGSTKDTNPFNINNSRYQNILKGLGLEEKDLKYKVTRDFNINEKDNWSILTNKQQVSSIMGAKPFVINTPDNLISLWKNPVKENIFRTSFSGYEIDKEGKTFLIDSETGNIYFKNNKDNQTSNSNTQKNICKNLEYSTKNNPSILIETELESTGLKFEFKNNKNEAIKNEIIATSSKQFSLPINKELNETIKLTAFVYNDNAWKTDDSCEITFDTAKDPKDKLAKIDLIEDTVFFDLTGFKNTKDNITSFLIKTFFENGSSIQEKTAEFNFKRANKNVIGVEITPYNENGAISAYIIKKEFQKDKNAPKEVSCKAVGYSINEDRTISPVILSSLNDSLVLGFKYQIKEPSGRVIEEKTEYTNSYYSNHLPVKIPDGKYTLVGYVLNDKKEVSSLDCTKEIEIKTPSVSTANTINEFCNLNDFYKNSTNCVSTKLAKSLTTNNKSANPGDILNYKVQFFNSLNNNIVYSPSLDVSDISEYAEVVDTGGALLDQESEVLKWSPRILGSNQYEEYDINIKVNNNISSKAKGTTLKTSYDNKISLINGTIIEKQLPDTFSKKIEAFVSYLPKINSFWEIALNITITILILIIYIRDKLLIKEIEAIRKTISRGVISND